VLREASQQASAEDAVLRAELDNTKMLVDMLMHVCRIGAFDLFVEWLRREYDTDDPRELAERELRRVHRKVMAWTSAIG
jgi:uncharacterized membrane protein YqhA